MMKRKNKEVLKRISSKRRIILAITKRKLSLIGQLLRHDSVLHTITEGQIEAKNKKDRSRLTYVEVLNTYDIRGSDKSCCKLKSMKDCDKPIGNTDDKGANT